MNSKLRLILIIIMCLILVSLITRNGSIALLTIPFLVYLMMGLLSLPAEIHLLASREVKSFRNYEFEPMSMTLVIDNNGSPISRMQISEPVHPGLMLLEGALEQRISIPSRGRTELKYSFKVPRGRCKWETARLSISDAFGLFEKHLDLQAAAQVCAIPKPDVLRRLKFRLKPNIRTAGSNLSRLPGNGTDFWGIREYHAGDSLHTIQWYKTARYPGTFYSKILEGEEIADVGLLLDARVSANQWFGEHTVFENSIQAAASLAKYYLSNGNRVSLFILNDRLVQIFPGYGKHQLNRILDELADASLGERATFETLKHLPVRLFPNRSVIALISPLLPDDFKPISRWVAEGYQLLCVSPNPFDQNYDNNSASPYESFALRTAILERVVLRHRIQRLGVQIIDWKNNQTLLDAFQSVPLMRK